MRVIDAKQAVFWTDRPDAPAASPMLGERLVADLVVVGGGLTGLWTALQAIEHWPGIRVVVLEAETCGFGASTRNGGFCDASLTHGLHNGLSHWPDEMATLIRMGNNNLDEIEATLLRHSIDCGFERSGELDVALTDWQMQDLVDGFDDYVAVGEDVTLLDQDGVRKLLDSPTFLGGMLRRGSCALVDPARLVWGLRAACERLGVQLFDNSAVVAVTSEASPSGKSSLSVATDYGSVSADRVIIATNAYKGPVKSQRRYVIPVYDHVLMTNPLSSEQKAAIGWTGREGVGDNANQFHYYRLTEDDRILWGGYDATYHFNNGLGPRYESQPAIHTMLAEHFFATFPQLEGLGFSHKWAGPIATTSRFTAAWGSGFDGRLVWVAGYTGLGVGSSRFGARVALDLAFGETTERTELEMVGRKPMPFPPEPLRWAAVTATKKAIQRCDDRDGKRGWWLGLLDRFGVGFDS